MRKKDVIKAKPFYSFHEMNSLGQSRISLCLSLTSQRQNNIQFQFEFTMRSETSRHTWWCVSVKRCCCENPPQSPRSDLLIGSSLLCDSHFPRLRLLWPWWLATVALPSSSQLLSQFLVSHGRSRSQGGCWGLLQSPGLRPQLQRGADYDRVQDQGQGESPRQDGGNGGLPGVLF